MKPIRPHPPLFIIDSTKGHNIKSVLINNGSSLNVVSSSTLSDLNILQSSLSSSTLQLRVFIDTISTTMGTIVLSLKVGPKNLHTLFHVIKGALQYNILLGKPWIDEMNDVSSTLHQCLKFIHEGNLTCVKVDLKSFQYCNFIPLYDDFLSSTCLVPFIPPSTSNVVNPNVVTSSHVVNPNVVTSYHVVNANVVTSSNVFIPSEVPSSGESIGKSIVSYTSPQI